MVGIAKWFCGFNEFNKACLPAGREKFMMAGGETKVGARQCSLPVGDLFNEFQSLDVQTRRFDKAAKPVVKLGDQKLILSDSQQVARYDTYARTTKAKIGDNKWITVQVGEADYGFATTRMLNIFGDHGNILVSLTDSNCKISTKAGEYNAVAISKQDKEEGKDAIIQGAILAVTGRYFAVVVLEK